MFRVSSMEEKSRFLQAVGSTLVYCYHCTNVGLSIHRRLLHWELRARVPLYRIFLTANHRWLRLQWAHEHIAWQADWHQAVFSDESCFSLWDYDSHIHVRLFGGERCLPCCIE
ncbi:uncharacterized protein TNCV_3511051 [Trichonephila clavipes]|nr:uncharacterized protein TNCV_3511051 [Trichonephila clavipes]